MEYIGSDGNAIDYDLELMLRIGEILDYKVEFIGTNFSALVPMLESGKADAAVTTDDTQKTGFWEGVRNSFVRTFITENRWKMILGGLEVTVIISICSGLLGSILGFGICLLRKSKNRWASVPASGFIRSIRGYNTTSLFLELFLTLELVAVNLENGIMMGIFSMAVSVIFVLILPILKSGMKKWKL